LRDRHAEAEAIIDESVRQCLQHHRGVLSTLLTYQADGALAGGDPARALDLAAQALLVAEPLGDYLRVGVARSVLAQIKALTIGVAHGLRAAQPDSLEALARIGAAIQPTPDDVRVLYAAGSARAKTGLPRGTDQQRAYDSTAANLRRALGETAFDRAAAEG